MCTSLMTTDTNGNAYHGRGFEFSVPLPVSMAGRVRYFV